MKYKGITRKHIRIPVQRIVLIVPVQKKDGADLAIDEDNPSLAGVGGDNEAS